MLWTELLYHVTRSVRMDETRVTRRRVIESIVENEELREHEERRDIFWEKNINIGHYASRKHLSWEHFDFLCVCCFCNLLFFIDILLLSLIATPISLQGIEYHTTSVQQWTIEDIKAMVWSKEESHLAAGPSPPLQHFLIDTGWIIKSILERIGRTYPHGIATVWRGLVRSLVACQR